MLVIDAYNVLHTTLPPGLAGLDVAGLSRALTRSKWRAGRMVVVCDGVAMPGTGPAAAATGEPAAGGVQGVELVYSGKGRTADEVIEELVDGDTAPRRITVVSSDREVQKAARRRRAKAWTSERFISELARSLAEEAQRGEQRRRVGRSGSGTREHPSVSDDEVQRWAQAFQLDPEAALHDDDELEKWIEEAEREEEGLG